MALSLITLILSWKIQHFLLFLPFPFQIARSDPATLSDPVPHYPATNLTHHSPFVLVHVSSTRPEIQVRNKEIHTRLTVWRLTPTQHIANIGRSPRNRRRGFQWNMWLKWVRLECHEQMDRLSLLAIPVRERK